jgi:hypothetical protein
MSIALMNRTLIAALVVATALLTHGAEASTDHR